MKLPYRIDLLIRLGQYILADNAEWSAAKEKAGHENGWFIPAFVDLAAQNIALSFLQAEQLKSWSASYPIQPDTTFQSLTGQADAAINIKKIGIVMAGNIPLVGFHDFLCVFISGHKAIIKTSSRDNVLITHLVEKLVEWDSTVKNGIEFSEMLKNCDAYIATGSNNSSRYFEYYFGKYPTIIRRNRTSVAVLTGDETKADLEKLADDVYLYFGLGCRNVTKLFIPRVYDFVPLLDAFRKYNHLADHHKYKNNFDYNLALHLLNKKYYMTNGSILLIEDPAIFSPISQLNYEFYKNNADLTAKLPPVQELQSIIGKNFIPFGQSQSPAVNDYADGEDTLRFLTGL